MLPCADRKFQEVSTACQPIRDRFPKPVQRFLSRDPFPLHVLAQIFLGGRPYRLNMTLAKTLQAGQPVISNRLFDRLLHEHPSQHDVTAQEWYRALLARGDFETISALARDEVLAGGPHASVWMRGVVFAARQSHRDDTLHSLRDSTAPNAVVWQPLLDAELLALAGRTTELRAVLDLALDFGKGLVLVGTSSNPGNELLFSTRRACPKCSRSFPELDPRLFSFNSKHGWCPKCFGTPARASGFRK